MFLQPLKYDDPRLDFYAVYKKEVADYDTDYVKKYDEDLNTTLIFVRHLGCVLEGNLTFSRRPVYSPPSAPPSSSTFIQSLNPIQLTDLQPSSMPSFSPSTNLPSQMKHPPFHPLRRTHPARLLQSLGLCMPVC